MFYKWLHHHSWQRVPKPPVLWRPRHIVYPPPPLPPFFELFPPLTPHALRLQPATSIPIALLLPCFFCWMGDRATFYDLLNFIMDLHLSSLGTLVPEGPCCVFYVTRHQVYWGMTRNMVFAFSQIYYNTHTQTKTCNTLRGQIDWHGHINTY